jgi:tetratricopeptide (TPR) repeat protein
VIRRLFALGLLLAAACGGTSVRKLPPEQSRYDALDAEGLRGLREARALLASGHAEQAVAALGELRVQHAECVYLALWQEEAEISARGLESVWPGAGGSAAPSAEQRAAIAELRQLWRSRAAESGGGESGVVVELVAAARLEEQPADARALLDQAAALDPRCAWVPYARAFLAARENDWAEVDKQIARSIELDPGHLPTFWLESWTLARGGDPGKASEALSVWLERARNDARIDAQLLRGAELDLAVLSVIVGEPKVAREWLDKLESQLPGESRALCARACAEEALGHVEQALDLAQKAQAAAPNALLPLVQQALIWQYWKKDLERAEKTWGEVLTLARSSPELGALFERLRARVLLDRRARETTAAAPPAAGPTTP